MGHFTNLSARLMALERAQLERAEADIRETQEKRQLQSEIRVLTVSVDDLHAQIASFENRATAVEEKLLHHDG